MWDHDGRGRQADRERGVCQRESVLEQRDDLERDRDAGQRGGRERIVAPGDPQILTINQLNPGSSMSFNFDFTNIGLPDFTNLGSSSNDVLRITNSMPFAAALGISNVVNLYIDASLVVGATNYFEGGFYADKGGAFDSSITGAVFKVFGSGVGALEFVKTVQTNAFGQNGYVMEFGVLGQSSMLVIPEPNVLVMWLAGAFTLWAARRRRRASARL